MTVNHGVPGSSPGEGALKKPTNTMCLWVFLFLCFLGDDKIEENLRVLHANYTQIFAGGSYNTSSYDHIETGFR